MKRRPSSPRAIAGLLAAVTLVSLAACSGAPNRLDGYELGTFETVPPTGPSAMTVFNLLYEYAFAAETGCPSARQDGETVILDGGCTTASGVEVFGRMTHRGSLGYVEIGPMTYEGFGFVAPSPCTGRAGETLRFTMDGTGSSYTTDTRSRFSANIEYRSEGVHADCEDRVIEGGLVYNGHVDIGDGVARVWNGNGRFGVTTVEGRAANGEGRFDVATVNAATDVNRCATEVLSGTTTITGERTVEILYDGESNCDPASTAPWSLDGVVQDGEVRGAI